MNIRNSGMNLFENIKFGSIIGKYLTGNETPEESGQIKKLVEKDKRNRELFNRLNKKEHIASAIENFESYNGEPAWKRYTDRLSMLVLKKRLYQWKVAAVIFLLIGISGFFAYLKVGVLDSVEKKRLYTTVTSPAGQNSRIVLPDNSVVWLNSTTTLSYNNDYSIKNREIKLSGQAFFQVERNEKIPLIVKCKGLNVKVLGTRFDVSGYPEDHTVSVVLESGSVELGHEKEKSVDLFLKPGDKAEFDSDSKHLSVNHVDTYRFTSWKDGVVIFKNDPMDKVLEKLERRYNIEIEVKDPEIRKLIFNATIINETVVEIFDLIKFTCSVDYQIIRSKDPEVPEKVILKLIK